MFTILGGDGKEYGPVTAGKIMEWLQGGRANLQTKARRNDETEWKALGEFLEFTHAPGNPAPLDPAAVGLPAHPATPVTFITPTAPLSSTVPSDGRAFADDVLARAVPLDVFECLSRSFALWKSHFLPLVGVTLLILAVQFAIAIVPILGSFAGLFLNGVFYGGLYYFYLGKMRGEPREIGDAFAGFSKAFMPLMLASLLVSGLLIAVMLPFMGSIFFAIIKAGINGQAGVVPPVPSGPIIIGIFVGCILMMYLSVAWAFTFALVIDKGFGPWTALTISWRVVNRQWFRVFFVLFLGGILTLLGFFGLFIGILFTLPLGFGAMLYAYEELFNPPARSAAPSLRAPGA
jgi:hypothetical protein